MKTHIPAWIGLSIALLTTPLWAADPPHLVPVQGHLAITGSLDISGDLDVEDAGNFVGALTVGGLGSFQGALTVNGPGTFQGQVTSIVSGVANSINPPSTGTTSASHLPLCMVLADIMKL